MNETYQIPWRYRLIRPPMKAFFRLLFHILGKVKITGKENIPYRTAYVVAINHISLFDPPLVAAFWPEILEIVGASDVFDRPGQGQIVKIYGVIPVHRGEYDRALLTKVIHALNSGHRLLIAPEGGRSHVPALQHGLPGVAYMIEATGVPVVPVGLVGTTDDFWQRAKHGERPRLEMRIGMPFQLPATTEKGAARREGRQRNADLVMRHIAGLLPESYRGVYADSAILPAKAGQ